MKTPIFRSRTAFSSTIFYHARAFGVAGFAAILSTNTVLAAAWNGSVSTDWNTFANWSGGAGSGASVTINSIPANVATISANITPTPTTIAIGVNTAARVDHVAGTANVAAPGDINMGRLTGASGTYNLANTAGTGGTLTGFGQGSGTLGVVNNIILGGYSGAGGIGNLNIHTTGTLSVGNQLVVGNPGSTGTVKMDSGTLSVVNALEIGNGAGSTGTFSMSGGTVTKSGAGSAVTVGGGLTDDGGTGTANLNGGTFTTAGTFRVGQNSGTTIPHSSGILNLAGTALTVNGEFWIGNNTGASGVMNFTSGTLTTNNWTSIGRKDDTNAGTGATGTVTMSGGTWIKNGETNFIVGDTGTGTMVMTGGLVIVNPHTTPDRGITWIGNRNAATGTLTISDTAEFRSPRIVLGSQPETTGTLNLNGGTVKTKGIYGGVGTSNVHFKGGKIIATDNSEDFINLLTVATFETGGLVVDTAGFNVTSAQTFDGVGGVTKSGAGSLSLTSSNSYTGNHTINEGKLFVSTDHGGNGSFTVANGAGMGVIQYFDTGTLNAPNVTFGTTGGSSIDFKLSDSASNPTDAPLHVSNTLRLNGTVTVNISDTVPSTGTFPLITYSAKTGAGTFALGSLPLGVRATLNDNGTGTVSLTISEITFPVWNGNLSANWETATQNWKELTTSDPIKYTDQGPAIFDDSAAGSTSVILSTTVTPSDVKFNNDTKPYTLTGSGKISGSASLTKMAAGTLEIGTVNEYTGVTTLGGGTTSVNSITNGGVASPLGKASAAAGNLVINGGILSYTGTTAASDRGFTNAGPEGGISVPTGVNLTLSGAVATTTGGSFDKRGDGTLTLTNPTVSLGEPGQTNEILAGTLALAGPGQTASIGGDLFVGSVPNVPGHLSVQNSNLTVTGVIAVGRGNGDTGTVSTVTATNSVVVAGSLSAGFDNGLPTNDSDQTLTLNNTNWTTNGTTLIGERQNSKTNMVLAGNSVYTAKSNIQMALNTTGEANITIQDTASLTHSGGWFSVGNDGLGTITVKNNGSLSTVNADFNVSDVGTSTGVLNIQDNGNVSATGTVFVGKNSGTTGTVNITGGTFTSATWVTIGRRAGAIGNFNISGGTVNQTNDTGFIVGENGTGNLTITGGTLNINGGGLYLSAEGAGTSVSKAFLNGGTIIAKRVVQRDFNNLNYTEFRFNGGVLRAQTGANSNFMADHDLVSVDAGGAFIDSNNQGITIAQVLVGEGSLTKQGTGVLTLSGTNTYAGNTTVSAGTLTLTKAYLSNSGTVNIAAGAVLNLTHGLVDQVAGLTIGGTPLAAGTYDSGTHPGVITGTGKLLVSGSTASAYDSWIAGYPSIPLADRDPGDDPDRDGSSNILEFALGGVPNSGSQRPQVYHIEADGSVDVGTNKELLMTIAVRSATPAFSSSTSPTATKDGVTYTIQGSTDLAGFGIGVTPVNVVAPAGNLIPPLGYEYRTFSLNGSDSLPNKGFLRVKVE
ncbi:autotransporter-associated beta strand repeat-containing protein [Luteolibacter yonseiensis]|uniref:Autotransporter-associated beta strand repeat-containing protein n=1 Tax=Luteolibacter yonseiensis TaxID=1144680 RepID=A0A934R4E9_9BACT|nr:autotransporter-associated beta strand repeat-containing protein [Luteolibacter yonseiensis]MBK1816717.1 autotransporter-associated beta strand repeat-containing protein [Luteolibacter yonseiensis]